MIASDYGSTENSYCGDVRICLENIEDLRGEYASSGGRLSAHVSELVRALLGIARQRERAFEESSHDRSSRFSERSFHGATPSADTVRALYSEICPFAGTDKRSGLYRTDDMILRTLTCSHLCAALKNESGEFSADALLGPLISPARGISVAYLQNTYSDEAFDAFYPFLCANTDDPPSTLLCDDLYSACDEVAAGNVSYCILPIENLSEGRLGGARKLIREYDLKIAHTVALKPKGIVFALLRKNLCRLVAAKNGPFFYEFNLRGENVAVGEILYAAEQFGLFVHKTDTVPLPYSDGNYRFDIILRCPDDLSEDGSSLISFILYLILEAPDFSPVGLYRTTERASKDNT